LRILIFLENNQNGGLNTFCSSLLNNWPNKDDEFSLVCNASHPGIKNLLQAINVKYDFKSHNIPISWVISGKYLNFLPRIIAKACQPVLRVFLLPIQFFLFTKIFKNDNSDELIVLNGGYPGGETCRLANIVWSSIKQKKGIHNFHNYAVSPRFGFGWFENWIDKKTIKATKSFISVSKSCSNSIYTRKFFNKNVNVDYIYNGVEIEKMNTSGSYRDKLNIGNSNLCVMLANYETRKGHGFVLEAFSSVLEKHPDTYLVFAGGGTTNDIERIKSQNNKLAVYKNVIFLNYIPDGLGLIYDSDIVLIGSQSFESFGLTAAEAMLLRKPIVSTNVGGLAEVIGSQGGCGFLVEKDQPQEFAMQIISLIEDQNLQKRMGDRGYKRVKKMFSAKEMSYKYHQELTRK